VDKPLLRLFRGPRIPGHFPSVPVELVYLAPMATTAGYHQRRIVVVRALASINVVNRHWARLLLGWVTTYGQVIRLGLETNHL